MLATTCKVLVHYKRPWSLEGLWEVGEGDDRGWDGWMALMTRWIWVWGDCRSWWWRGRPGVLWFMASQESTRLCDWTELNWIDDCAEIRCVFIVDACLSHWILFRLIIFGLGCPIEPLSVQCLSQEGVIHVIYNLKGIFVWRVMCNLQALAGSSGVWLYLRVHVPHLEHRTPLFPVGLPQRTVSSKVLL